MALIKCTECGKEYSDKAKNCPNCGCPTDAQNTSSVVSTQDSDLTTYEKIPRNKVVEHLKYAKELETTKYTLNMSYNRIEQIIQSLGHKRKISPPAEPYFDFPVFGTFFVSFAILLVLSCAILEGSALDVILIITILPLFFGSSHLLVDLGIALGGAFAIALIGSIIHISIRHSKYNSLFKKYKQEVYADNERVKKEQKEISILQQQQQTILFEYNKNEKLLKKLYDLDVIFPKYRHMVAVITILEYFESGKCSKMTGPHGAYEIYDYEELLKKIITNLETIIYQLDQIKNTQYMLYEAIQEANYNAECIYENSREILKSSNETAKNTALIAYNSERIRRNTEISAYIDLFD